MVCDGKVKAFLFDMSVPQYFITAPCALTRASDFEEGATTESMQKTDGMLPNARSIPAKKTCYSCDHTEGPRPSAEYLRKRNILVAITSSFPLSFWRRSPFLTVVNPATPANHAWNAGPRRIS